MLITRLSAFEQGLSEGLRTERRLFHMTSALADQKEGAWRVFLFSFQAVDISAIYLGVAAFAGEKTKIQQLITRLLLPFVLYLVQLAIHEVLAVYKQKQQQQFESNHINTFYGFTTSQYTALR